MGNRSRLKMLKDKINNIRDLKKNIEIGLKTVTDEKRIEAKANTENFNKWWKNNYLEEYLKTETEVRMNRNLPSNTVLILKRMNDWRKSL